jgi:hypothetical protein
MLGKKKQVLVRDLEKNQYVHLGNQPAAMSVFHVQRFGTKSEKGPIQNIISGRTFYVLRVCMLFVT